MAPLEPWEKVLVDREGFAATVHGEQSCSDCHGGQLSPDKDTAHTGLIADPSADPETVCGDCHSELAAAQPDSLHATQAGYWTALEARSLPERHPALETMFANHCASCHTTCGDCHISQPDNVGGGLLEGHAFVETPPMTRTCTACHGSRVGNEYLGRNEEVPGDVHFREARMNCAGCHTGSALHGLDAGVEPAAHRYEGAPDPSCESCHPQAAAGGDDIAMHGVHGDQLACQVCHSVTYSNCDSCHVAVSTTSGRPFFETSATYQDFLIGRNPLRSDERPYAYVPVRHVPAAPDGYSYYGDDLLPNFDARPTWTYATPHNIQRRTPQNASCNACHGNPALFLTADRVAPAEREANQSVIVSTIPAPRPEP